MQALERVDVGVSRENHKQPSIPDELALVRGHRRPRYPRVKTREERPQRRSIRRCQRPRHVQHPRVLAQHARGHKLEGIQRATTATATAAGSVGGCSCPEHQRHPTVDGDVVRVSRNTSLVEGQDLLSTTARERTKKSKLFIVGAGGGGDQR